MIKTLLQDIAPARAMGIRVNGFKNGRIELVAPFGPNINDKGTAFAGSIASMLTLAGWGAITLHLQEAGVDAKVMVVKSETNYTSAAQSALFAEATVSKTEMARVFQELEEKGRSRIKVESTVHSDGVKRATMTASFAVILLIGIIPNTKTFRYKIGPSQSRRGRGACRLFFSALFALRGIKP